MTAARYMDHNNYAQKSGIGTVQSRSIISVFIFVVRNYNNRMQFWATQERGLRGRGSSCPMASVPHLFISHSWSNSAHRQLELSRCQLVQTLRGVMAASPLVSTSLLLLHFLAFCSLPSSAQAQELENEWDAPFFCSDASSSRDPTCGTGE